MPRRASTHRSSHVERIGSTREALLAWFRAHQRSLPWRKTRDPYAIWVSEVMLQQTRVETVLGYYARFLERFPDVKSLARAPLDRVLAAWSGLGYYRRARMLHAGARAVLQHHGGVIPSEAALLRELPGVGRYTAGAIASIAFGRREPVVDGNVERVLTRWDAIAGDPRRGPVREQLWSLAAHFADGPNPGDVNQSLMELGATICLPSNPGCGECSIAATCRARVHGDPERFPQKAARAAVRDERWWALIGTDQRGERVWLEKRGPGRWHGMLLPPIGQGQPELVGARRVEPCGTVRHVLTHAAMEFEVYRGVVSAPVSRGELVALRTLDARAIPQVTRRLIARALEAQSTERSAARTPRASAVASNTSPARRASKSR